MFICNPCSYCKIGMTERFSLWVKSNKINSGIGSCLLINFSSNGGQAHLTFFIFISQK